MMPQTVTVDSTRPGGDPFNPKKSVSVIIHESDGTVPFDAAVTVPARTGPAAAAAL